MHSLEDAFHLAEQLETEEAFVIGGGEIYKEALKHVTSYTLVDFSGEADTFSDYNKYSWENHFEEFPAEDNQPKWSFSVLLKK